MRIGILGSGLMGGKLGTIFARAGHDAGPLHIARYTEPFALLVGELACNGQRGPEMAYRFEWFGK